jgi:hypothetical protein
VLTILKFQLNHHIINVKSSNKKIIKSFFLIINFYYFRCKDHMIFGNIYGGEIAKWLTVVLGQSLDLVCFDTSYEPRKLVNMKKNLQV